MSLDDVNRHHGAGMLEAAEFLLRQVLVEGLVELAGDRVRLRELVARSDTLRQGSQVEWVDDHLALVDELVQIGAPGGLTIGVGYPPDDAHLPYVGIVKASASEQPGGASCGDVIGIAFDLQSTPTAADFNSTVSTRVTTIGVDVTTSLQVSTWATTPDASMLISAIVRHLVFRHKGRLEGAGVHEVTTSESGFEPSPQLYPRTGYVPVLNVSLEWTYRQARRTRRVPTRVRVISAAFGN